MLTQTLFFQSEPNWKLYVQGYSEEIECCRKVLKKLEKGIRNYKKIIYESQKSYDNEMNQKKK